MLSQSWRLPHISYINTRNSGYQFFDQLDLCTISIG